MDTSFLHEQIKIGEDNSDKMKLRETGTEFLSGSLGKWNGMSQKVESRAGCQIQQR